MCRTKVSKTYKKIEKYLLLAGWPKLSSNASVVRTHLAIPPPFLHNRNPNCQALHPFDNIPKPLKHPHCQV